MKGDESETTQKTGERIDRAFSKRRGVSLRWIFPLAGAPAPAVLRKGATVIGRDPSCDIVIASGPISRRHVELQREGPVVTVRNLSATNRIHLDGAAVSHAVVSSEQILRVGDHLAIISDGDVDDDAAFEEVQARLWIGPSMRNEWALALRAAQTDLPVYLSGPTGTGKDRIAQAIHAQSGRSGSFVPVNCAAMSEALVESELFGHQKGAFTGAHAASLGKFQAAHGGTLFLDELADLPRPMQAKLLRVLEDGVVWPVGATRGIPVNVRILAAAQQSLDDLVDSGQIRRDLRERLGAIEINLPPLSSRRAEILALFERLLTKYSTKTGAQFDVQVAERLCLHEWHGNIRELDHLARRLAALGDGKLSLEALPERFQQSPSARTSEVPASKASPEADRRRLGHVLAKNGGRVNDAAVELGFSRQRAYRLLRGRTPSELIQALDLKGVVESG